MYTVTVTPAMEIKAFDTLARYLCSCKTAEHLVIFANLYELFDTMFAEAKSSKLRLRTMYQVQKIDLHLIDDNSVPQLPA